MTERLLRRPELAAMLGCSPATIARLEARGALPPRRQLSRAACGWLESEVVAYLRSLPAGPLTDRMAAARAARKESRGPEAA